jgi:hypothetical protein
MAIIFNSITQFERQPERTKKRVKRDDLDTLTEVWVGPSVYEDTFVPVVGARHPDFNLMTVISTSIKRLPASVSEITINYQGKLDSAGAINYTSLPTISLSWMEGEVSYQSFYTPPPVQGVVVAQGGVNTYSRRYTGRCCQVAYITTRRPTGNPTNIGLANDFLGFTNIWEVLSSFQTGSSVPSLQGPPIQQMVCTDVRVEDKADGWYRVTESYQSRQFPGPAVRAPASGFIANITAPWTKAEAGAGQPVQTTNPTLPTTTGAAQAAATYAGVGLPYTPVSEQQKWDAMMATGIDVAWASTPQAAAAAAQAGFTQVGGGDSGIGVDPAPLEF